MNTELELKESRDRVILLLEVLAYQRINMPNYLSISERWQIHYERGSHYQRMEGIKLDMPKPLRFRVPDKIESKINHIITKMRTNGNN